MARLIDGWPVPKTIPLPPAIAALLQRQDGLVTALQLSAHGLDPGYAHRRVASGRWQRLLPGVWLTATGVPSRRQRVMAAWLWAGPDAAVDGACACAWYGVQVPGFSVDKVHVVAPFEASARSSAFVVVRRALAEIKIGARAAVPYVDASTAFIVAARTVASPATAIAVLSRPLQQGLVTVASLAQARECLGDKWCGRVDAALVAVGVGLRSPAEKTAHDLLVSSRILPEPLWNQWLDLGDGGYPVCADALWEDAGMINEVLGRKWHAWAEQFESTEARRARLVAAGLVVQGCTAIQLTRHGPGVLKRLEQTYMQNVGRGLPAGVRLIDPPR